MNNEDKPQKSSFNLSHPISVCTLVIVFIAFFTSISLLVWAKIQSEKVNQNPPVGAVSKEELPTFDSCSQLAQVLDEAKKQDSNRYLEDGLIFAPTITSLKNAEVASPTGDSQSATPDYSQTNVQVEGVDEADIVKSDGEYFYIVHQYEVIIAKAYPPKDAQIVSRINVKDGAPQEIFINGNVLAIIGQKSASSYEGKQMDYYYPRQQLTFVDLWNVKKKANPQFERGLEFEGNAQSSRMIGDFVYLVLNSYPDYIYEDDDIRPMPLSADEEDLLPQYKETGALAENSEFEPICDCAQVKSLAPIDSYNYLTVSSISLKDLDKKVETETLLGASENLYASLQNLYIANTNYNYEPPRILEQVLDRYIAPQTQQTQIFKFALKEGKINYQGQTAVNGTVLNQFSMDEYDSNLRIATTQGNVSRSGGGSSNNLYVLDEDLELIGKIEDIAPGEKIYSARFMGKKGYLVTFKKVDPFFTLDLSNPKNPKIAGKLKIPGYSDYLHPLDEKHILGLGKNTVEAEEGEFAWYQGVKMAIFDVSDFDNPKETAKIEIGNRGTDSYALHDHKAFLYDQKKGLLVIPVLLAELTPEQIERGAVANSYGEYKFQGAYVYRIDTEKGFTLLGRITHYNNFQKSQGYYYYGDNRSIMRSMYIGDYLYTLSGEMFKINKLYDLENTGKVEF